MDLPDKDFLKAIIKMPQLVITNSLKMNTKNEKSQQRNRDYEKENQT